MYISVFPIAISVRRTNVYEEQSLGIWGSPFEDEEDGKDPSYVGAHLRRQLSFDLWYVFLGLFIIAIAEGRHLQNVNEYVSARSRGF
jgi:Trk-type K+ transport system membrane component